MRHWHKYTSGQLDPQRRFYFRRATPAPSPERPPQTPGNSSASCEPATMPSSSTTATHGDFSRWVADVLGDPPLAAAIAAAENTVRTGTASTAQAPASLTSAIRQRYTDT